MKVFKIEGKDDIPHILFDVENNQFEISGVSLPEDSKVFYEPVLAWWKKFEVNLDKKIEVNIKMVYYNTSTSKIISEIFDIFENLKEKGLDICVNWYFIESDIDMKKAGMEYDEWFNLEFNLIAEEFEDDEDYY